MKKDFPLTTEDAYFLKTEAKRMFKKLHTADRKKMGSYKPLYDEMRESWKAGNTINTKNPHLKTRCERCGSYIGQCGHLNGEIGEIIVDDLLNKEKDDYGF